MLKILRFILPPFSPVKYWWIKIYFGKQDGGYWNTLGNNKNVIKAKALQKKEALQIPFIYANDRKI